MPVQAQAIPIVAEGHDLIATAQTGTGKTLGFALPSLSKLCKGKQEKNMMLVLVPTRELAVQVHAVIRDFGQALKIRSTAIYGGVGMNPQIDALRRGCGVIVATPGRLLDHLQQGTLDFKNLKVLVLDEADRMLDMGFLPDIKRILSQLPKKRQTLMFSATFDDDVTKLAREMLDNPKRVTVGMTTRPVDTVKQVTYAVRQGDKTGLLLSIFKQEKPASALTSRGPNPGGPVGKMLRNTQYFGIGSMQSHAKSRQIALDGFKAQVSNSGGDRMWRPAESTSITSPCDQFRYSRRRRCVYPPDWTHRTGTGNGRRDNLRHTGRSIASSGYRKEDR